MGFEGAFITVAGAIGYLWDRVTFIPWFLLSGVSRKLAISSRIKSRPVIDGDVSGEWQSGDADQLVETYYYGKKTLNEIFNISCQKFSHLPLFGTRELLSEEDEIQPNGKTFKKAIYGEYKWETYAEVQRKVTDLAKGLTELGIKRVAIYMETRADFMIAVQACFQHNIQIVTVYATLGEQAVTEALVEADVEHVITSAALLDTRLVPILSKVKSIKNVVYASFEQKTQRLKYKPSPDSQHKLHSFDAIYKLGHESILAKPAPPTPDTISVIMYTSGTSGKAKGVLISQANMVAAISGIGERLQMHTRFTPTDTYIAFLPLAHILELMAENVMVFCGSRIGYSSPLTLSDRSSRIKKGTMGDATILKPTVMASVPEILERIRKGVMANVEQMSTAQKIFFKFAYNYKEKQVALGRDTPILNAIIFKKTSMILGGHMRAMLSGGAPLEEKTQRFIEICISVPLVIGYGLTESTGGVAINDICEYRPGRTGGVIDTGLVKLVEWKEGGYSPQNKPHPQGEVWAGGHMIAQGYYKMEEKTKEDFHVDSRGIRWFKTGDIGQFDEDGSLRLIDRKKDLVKLRHGEYIALGKIEAALKTSALVTNVGVFVDSNEMTCVAIAVGNETELAAIAKEKQLKGGFSDWANAPEIVDAVKKSLLAASKESGLSKQEIPSAIYIETLQWLPETGLITDAFKIKRKALNEHYASIVAKLYNKK